MPEKVTMYKSKSGSLFTDKQAAIDEDNRDILRKELYSIMRAARYHTVDHHGRIIELIIDCQEELVTVLLKARENKL